MDGLKTGGNWPGIDQNQWAVKSVRSIEIEQYRNLKQIGSTMTNTTTIAEEVCLQIARRLIEQIVLHPEHLKAEQDSFDPNTINFQLHRGDMARLMGEQGAKKKGIQYICKLIGRKQGKNIHLHFDEPEIGEYDRYPRFEVVDPWNSATLHALVSDIADAALEHPATVKFIDGVAAKDKGKTRISVLTSPEERKETLEELNLALGPLFKAIGMANGRSTMVINFEVDPEYTKNDVNSEAPSYHFKDWGDKTHR